MITALCYVTCLTESHNKNTFTLCYSDNNYKFVAIPFFFFQLKFNFNINLVLTEIEL